MKISFNVANSLSHTNNLGDLIMVKVKWGFFLGKIDAIDVSF